MSEPRVAILILNWNRWKDTIECLESVLRLTYDNFTVVVCDNGSADDSVKHIGLWARGMAVVEPMAGSPLPARPPVPKPVSLTEISRAEAEAGTSLGDGSKIYLIRIASNLGFSGGNNVGLRALLAQSDIDYVWLLNNDAVADPDCLGNLVECAESSPGTGAVGATVLEYGNPAVVEAAGGGAFSGRYIYPSLDRTPMQRDAKPGRPLDFITGACLLAPMAAVRTVGLLDESYFLYCEDVDYSIRFRNHGYRLQYASEARIWHKGGSSTGHRSARHDYYTMRNTLELVRRYVPNRLAFATAYAFYLFLLPKLIRGQRLRMAAVWRGYRDYRKGILGKATI